MIRILLPRDDHAYFYLGDIYYYPSRLSAPKPENGSHWAA